VKSIDELVANIRADIRGRSGIRFITSDVVRAINESIQVISTSLSETKEDLLVDSDNGGLPTVYTIPAAGADGASRIQKPSWFGRIRKVEVLMGSSWIPIRELKTGEWQAGEFPLPPESTVGDGMTYESIGRWIIFRPGMIAPATNAVRISKEVEIPPLFMGIPAAYGTATLTLSSVLNEAEGTLPSSSENDAYNTLLVKIYEGTGIGQVQECIDYVGSTRVMTFPANWNPALGASSKFAFMTPFYDILSGMDTLIQARSCIVMLSTQRLEDVSSYVARYNEIEESLLVKLGRMSPGPGRILPVDMMEDFLY